jgi:hypothetical protein
MEGNCGLAPELLRKGETEVALRLRDVANGYIPAFSGALPPKYQDDQDQAHNSSRPEVRSLVPIPIPHQIAVKMGRFHFDADLKIAFLSTVEVPDGKGETNNYRKSPSEKHANENGHN